MPHLSLKIFAVISGLLSEQLAKKDLNNNDISYVNPYKFALNGTCQDASNKTSIRDGFYKKY